MRSIIIILGLLVTANSCVAPGPSGRFAAAGGSEPDIRVLLEEGKGEIVLQAEKGFNIQTTGGLVIVEAPAGSRAHIAARYPSLNVTVTPGNAVSALEGEAVIVPRQNSALSYGNRTYGGVMTVTMDENGGLSLLNVLPLEAYLEGVLPYEIGNPGPEGYDALKSQAVAARTYAIGKMNERAGGSFDVYASVQDQVYRGQEGTTRVATAAVRDTRGRVLDYDGETARTYYSACCGGHTSDIRLVWPTREPKDYLHGITDQTRAEKNAFCREYKYFRWRYSFTGREMGEVLRVTLPTELGVSVDQVGALKNIYVEERSTSGRVIKLVIETTKDNFIIEGDRIRWVLMADVDKGRILPSVMFRLDKAMERDRIALVSIAGGGNGHGVGMCQNGAIAMAKRGYTYRMILTHYYPGCTIEKMY